MKNRKSKLAHEQPPPQPPAVAAGAIFIDGGQCYLVYKREDRECNLETLDVAYYYPAKGPKPTEQNYLTVCKHSGVAEVTRRITATADAANACARVDRKKRDGENNILLQPAAPRSLVPRRNARRVRF